MPSRREPAVVIVGHVTHERTGATVVPGGPAYYGAHTHRGLGASVRLVSAVGDDFACAGALAGLPAELRRGGRTTTITHVGGARLEALAPPVLAVDLPEAWRRCDLLHLAPVLGEVDLARWTQVAHPGLVGISAGDWTRWELDPRALARVDAACIGEDDLRERGDLLDRLAAAISIVAVIRGDRGCELIVRGRTLRVGTYPARAELDPAGARHAFPAAFFYGLARGSIPTEAAQLAAAAASIIVEGHAGATFDRVAQAWRRCLHVPAEPDPGYPVTATSRWS